MDAGDWRSQLQAHSRQKIVNKIMDTLKRHLPFSGQDGLQELNKIAIRFEEKTFTAATSQSDYLRKISMKMLTMETKSPSNMANTLQGNAPSNNQNGPDPGSSTQPQVNSQGQQLSMPIVPNQSQARSQLLSQNVQNNVTPNAMQVSASLPSALPTVQGINQTTVSNVVGQNSNLPNIQNITGGSQNSIGNQIGQTSTSSIFANSQRPMQVRQQQIVPLQPQQQPQNSQHFLYPPQLQNQLIKQKFQQGNSPHSHMQSHMQQQQLQPSQNMLQSNQVQSSQQSVLQPSVIQTASLSGLQHNQQPTQQSVRQPQQSQQTSILHQQQQLLSQQPNAMNMPQNQLIGQQNSVDVHHHQQQRLLSQDNNLSNLQQQQQQQHLIGQQNSHSNMHQQQLGPQCGTGLQQQQQPQLLGTQSGSCSMQTNQHSLHIMHQSKIPAQQQNQQNGSTLLPTQGQQSQAQLSQQQLVSQIQSQPVQMQQQLSMQQQTSLLQRDIQQRLQTTGPLLQQQNVIDQQKQLFPSQRAVPEASSTSLDSTAQTGNANGGDWQEEIYQKIKGMKEMCLSDLSEMFRKVAAKLQQHETLSQQPKNHQLDKFKMFKDTLERLIAFLQLSKSNIQPFHREKLGIYEKQIVTLLQSHRPHKPVLSPQQGQLSTHMQSLQQSQSQISQTHPHENLVNPQMQSINLQGPVATMQQHNMTSLQHSALSSGPGVSNTQQNIVNSLQPSSNLDPSQGNTLNSLQQVAVGSLQQNPVSGPQQVSMNSLSSQSGINAMQSNLNTLQSNSNMLQQQHLKQQEQQILQTQQLKQQMQQHQMHQQLIHKQLMQQQQQQHQQQQQLQQQPKQQQPAQMPGNQLAQLHQMADISDLKTRQQISVKPGVFQQHHSVGQRPVYQHLKIGSANPISSPQLLHAQSPQFPQHSSPQIDQSNLSLTKTGTPLQSANSPFVVPSPPTPLAPSPMQGESEKINTGVSTLSNAVNIGHPQAASIQPPGQSLAIGTPGISASPLLAEFTSPDGNHGNGSANLSGKSSVTEQPLERLIKVVKSMSPKALSTSVSDISSVVSMIDRIAGSAPGNGSRAAVGEDLVAMTKCRLQARNFINHDGTSGSKKMRRCTTAMPLNIFSSSGSINHSCKQLMGVEASDLESTATSSIMRPRIEANHTLLEEIREINDKLIDTVVDISYEDVGPTAAVTAAAAAAECGDGTVVRCSFTAVALSPNLKSQYASAQMSPIQPLHLLVPANYPNCSPILLDKFPVEVSKEYEDLSIKAKSRFSISLRSLSQPMSLGEIARTWDVCARAVISECAQQSGGGSFCSKYGNWENCLSAA